MARFTHKTTCHGCHRRFTLQSGLSWRRFANHFFHHHCFATFANDEQRLMDLALARARAEARKQ